MQCQGSLLQGVAGRCGRAPARTWESRGSAQPRPAARPLRRCQTLWPAPQQHVSRRHIPKAVGVEQAAGAALFFAPGLLALVYAYFKGKGNLSDGLSRLLTEVSQGYFQPDVGGKNIPVSEGELSDLAGDEPLFKALYKW